MKGAKFEQAHLGTCSRSSRGAKCGNYCYYFYYFYDYDQLLLVGRLMIINIGIN